MPWVAHFYGPANSERSPQAARGYRKADHPVHTSRACPAWSCHGPGITPEPVCHRRAAWKRPSHDGPTHSPGVAVTHWHRLPNQQASSDPDVVLRVRRSDSVDTMGGDRSTWTPEHVQEIQDPLIRAQSADWEQQPVRSSDSLLRTHVPNDAIALGDVLDHLADILSERT